MAYRKEIIVISGGKHKGVVKLNSSVGHSGWLKGNCSLDFVPKNGVLYLVGDSTVEVEITERDVAFEVRECAKNEISCVLLSSEPAMFGSTKQNAQRTSIIASVENLQKEKLHTSQSTQTKNDKDASMQNRSNLYGDEIGAKQSRPNQRESWDLQKQGSAVEKPKLNDKKSDNYTKNTLEKDVNSNKADRRGEERGGEALSNSDRVFAFDNGVRYEGNNFYLAIKPQIDEMFVCFPNEERLNAVVPNSKWVRVDTGEDFYVVGLLFDVDAPIFICYGIPGNYSIKPPEDLGDMCVWLPLSLDDKFGDGFWVIYQSAVDGKIVK